MRPPEPVYQAKVTATAAAVPGVTRVQLTPLDVSFPPHLPGQHITCHLPDHVAGPDVRRSYSIASASRADGSLDVCIKPSRTSAASTWLCAPERLGDTLTISAPAGGFGPTTWTRPLLLCGAGTGMAPLLAIATHAANEGTPTRVFAAAATDAHHLGADLLADLAARSLDWHVTWWSDTERGLPSVDAVRDWLTASPHPAGDADLYVCGPPAFCDLVEAAARVAKLPEHCVHRERFDVPPH